MQNIKPSDMTGLEEFSLWLAANGELGINPNPGGNRQSAAVRAAFGSGKQHRKHNSFVEVSGQNF